jgi:hypothetical protein
LPASVPWFTVAIKEDNAVISWNAANVLPGTSFVVERSANGFDFLPIQKQIVDYTGNDKQYSITDYKLPPGTWYYRLAMKSVSGDVRYTAVKKITIHADSKVQVLPTVITNKKITVLVPAAAQFLLFGSGGQPVIQQHVNAGMQSITIPAYLRPGIYMYSITNDGGVVASGKLLLQ